MKFSTFSIHDTSTTSEGNTGSPSLRHASCPTQAEGWWSRTSLVRLGLCRMQATRWQVTATEMLLPLCETRSENKRKKKRLLQGHKDQRKQTSTAKEERIKSMQQQTRQNANSAGAKIPNFISQGSDTASCHFLPRLLQSILHRRRRSGCRPAQHTSALMHHDQKRNAISTGAKIPNFISQGSAAANCCFLPRLLQSILRRRRRFG